MGEERAYQRIQIRLRRDQLDESRVLSDYEARSEILGKPDHDYLRHLILIGHLFVTQISSSNIGKACEGIALSTNESNNTGKELANDSNGNGSNASSEFPTEVGSPEVVVGTAIRAMAGIFGGTKAS